MNTKDINVNVIPLICDHLAYYPQFMSEKDRDKKLSLILSVRDTIENKVSSEYSSSITGYIALANKYHRKAKTEMKWQFIKNLHKYPLNHSFGIVKSYLRGI